MNQIKSAGELSDSVLFEETQEKVDRIIDKSKMKGQKVTGRIKGDYEKEKCNEEEYKNRLGKVKIELSMSENWIISTNNLIEI